MGKPRTPKGRSSGQNRTPPREPPPGDSPDATSGPAEDAPQPVLLDPGQDPSTEPLHAHLLDTVSPGILGDQGHARPPVEASVPADADRLMPAVPTAKRIPDNVVPLVATAPTAAIQRNPAPAEPAAPAFESEPRDAPAGRGPASWRAGARRPAPLRRDFEGIGETLFAFVRGEGAAAVSHLQALKEVRSPADAIRLQVGEIQRAADASLSCWSKIARRAARLVAPR